jgi:phosphate ABC transporter permease protein PstC
MALNAQHRKRLSEHADAACSLAIRLIVAASCAIVLLVFIYIAYEAFPFFQSVPLSDFLGSSKWMPIDFGNGTSYGIANFICATLMTSALAVAFALLVAIGAALFLSCSASTRLRQMIYPFIDMLAGVPSVIFGFIGLVVVVTFFINKGIAQSGCVLAASLVLAVMILPFLVTSMSESIVKVKKQCLPASQALGVDRWYAVAHSILPLSLKFFIPSIVMAFGRAMGETMAVLMIIGNANIAPTLLGKGESIASLIALEMGGAVRGSMQYHALFAAGFILMVLIFVIDIAMSRLLKKMQK